MLSAFKALLPGGSAAVAHPAPMGMDAPVLLVVASNHTFAAVSVVAEKLGLQLAREETIQGARHALGRPCHAIKCVVAALGTTKETFLLDSAGGKPSLIAAADSIGVPLVVYSHTAAHPKNHATLMRACLDGGALAVVDSKKGLQQVMVALLQQSQQHPPGPSAAAQPSQQTSPAHQQAVTAQPQPQPQPQPQQHAEQQQSGLDALPAHHSYPPLDRQCQRLQYLRAKYGDDHKRTQRCASMLTLFSDMVQRTPPLAAVKAAPAAGAVRFVVVSDTHTQHRQVELPDGEVLIHCGDITGNYRLGWVIGMCLKPWEDAMHKELLDFAAWLSTVGQKYRRVFVLPGNHDTLLDVEAYPQHASSRAAFYAALPPNTTVLQEAAASYRGLKLWGSPTVVCRLEAQGQSYISNGFERTEARRKAVWAQVPEGLDVLLTHTPPHGGCGDHLLLQAMAKLSAPPKLHVFGHAHGGAGCGVVNTPNGGSRVWINAAQSSLLHHQQGGGGFAWVFDLPAPH